MKRLFTLLLSLILPLCLLLSCTLETQPDEIEEVTEDEVYIEEPVNEPPIADAGEDINCCTGEEFTLDGRNSSDPNGDSLSYIWDIKEEEYSGETLTFIANESGTYFVTLTVSDGKVSDSDMVKIIVEDKVEIVEETTENAAPEEYKAEEDSEENLAEEELVKEIEILSLTSPVERGSVASITIKTSPNVPCTITVYYKSGPSQAQGLDPKNSDSDGNCSWSWTVGGNTTPGDWKILVTAEGAKNKEVYFTVTKTEQEIASEQQQQQEEPQQEEPPAEEPSYGITVTQLTSPIGRGSNATISINTAPNTYCTITVYYKSGASTAQGLGPKNSDGNGNCSWTWKVGTRTTPGDWRIVINVQGIGQIEQYFTVTG